jgi:hypothetical protein
MSAWSIGRKSGAGTLAGNDATLKSYIDRVTQWIPADAIALYLLGITALQTQHPNPNPNWVLLGIGLGLSLVLVLLAAWATRKRVGRKDITLAVLATVAFAIWSLAVPESGWHRIHWVATNPGWIFIIAAGTAVVFGIIADPLANMA